MFCSTPILLLKNSETLISLPLLPTPYGVAVGDAVGDSVDEGVGDAVGVGLEAAALLISSLY